MEPYSGICRYIMAGLQNVNLVRADLYSLGSSACNQEYNHQGAHSS